MTATGRLRDWTRRLAEEPPSAAAHVDAVKWAMPVVRLARVEGTE